jgi:hypothetical protein
VAEDRGVIRNVVIHVNNEQPLLADLFDLPSAADVGLVCTNLRLMDGKRPIFIDKIESTFFFPYLVVRFIEIPPGAIDAHRASGGRVDIGAGSPAVAGAAPEPGSTLPVVVAADADDDGLPDLGEEIDEDFLRRIRDI